MPRGAVRICYTEDEQRISETFRSMEAVPEDYDKCKIKEVTARDDIEITLNNNELKKVRGFQIILEKGINHKKKSKKKKLKSSKLEGTDTELYVDPSLENDPIDKKL